MRIAEHNKSGIVAVIIFIAPIAACSKENTPPGARAANASDRDPGAVAEAQSRPLVTSRPVRGELLTLNSDALRDLRLTTRKVELRGAGETISAVGTVEADPNDISVISFPAGARVLKISKGIGERVEAGETLVELDSIELARLQLAVESTRARAAIAQRHLDVAEQQQIKNKELFDLHMLTIKELQASELEVAEKKAELADAQRASIDAEKSLSALGIGASGGGGKFTITAGSSGIVYFRDGFDGGHYEAGHIYYKIARTDSVITVVHPFERDGARIDNNAKSQIFAAAFPGRIFDAHYLRSGPEVDASSRTIPVRFRIINKDGALRPGMSVTAEIRIITALAGEIISVPLAAVQRLDRDWCVFVPLGRGQFERRVIARGRDLGGEIEVLSGLDAGEEIVVEGAFVLRSESVRDTERGDEHEH